MDLIKVGNLIAGRGERPFAPTEEWRSYLILIPKRVTEAVFDRFARSLKCRFLQQVEPETFDHEKTL